MTVIVITSCAAALLAIIAAVIAAMCMRRAETAAGQSRAAAKNSHTSATQARTSMQQTEGLTTAYANGPAPILAEPPKCPMDGQPLAGYRSDVQPAVFVHLDGTQHYDRMAQVTQPPVETLVPNPYLPPAFEQPPVQQLAPEPLTFDPRLTRPPEPASAGAADIWGDRVATAEKAGLIDPNALVAGIGHITRGGWLPEPTDLPADPPSETVGGRTRPKMPDPTKAARVHRAPPHPRPEGPIHPNGDGA